MNEASRSPTSKRRRSSLSSTLVSRRTQIARDGSEQERLKSSLTFRERGPSSPRLLSEKKQRKEEKARQSLVQVIMANKVLGAYVLADLLFVITGALMVGFCVIVQNKMFEVPTDGSVAVENLLYQMFPLTGRETQIQFPDGHGRGWQEKKTVVNDKRMNRGSPNSIG